MTTDQLKDRLPTLRGIFKNPCLYAEELLTLPPGSMIKQMGEDPTGYNLPGDIWIVTRTPGANITNSNKRAHYFGRSFQPVAGMAFKYGYWDVLPMVMAGMVRIA